MCRATKLVFPGHFWCFARMESLGIIAGKGVYPRELAASARKQGVERIFVTAFKGETDPIIEKFADEVKWMYVGQLAPFIDAYRDSGVHQAVMAGQITPKNLFNLRFDKAMREMLGRLPRKNADSIFSAIGEELAKVGVELTDASLFMESTMPEPGTMTGRSFTEQERLDADYGYEVARTCCAMNIGQTVVIKTGSILAVEAFEGTDAAIKRAGKLGGKGTVVVKMAGRTHDMRFDIPVVGLRTLKSMKKAGATALAVEAGRTVFLERAAVIKQADELNIAIEARKLDEQ
ncbi:MAG: DUF1009 family protein [Kiritimatiellia bacterium]|jgi:DUF1009 family protein